MQSARLFSLVVLLSIFAVSSARIYSIFDSYAENFEAGFDSKWSAGAGSIVSPGYKGSSKCAKVCNTNAASSRTITRMLNVSGFAPYTYLYFGGAVKADNVSLPPYSWNGAYFSFS